MPIIRIPSEPKQLQCKVNEEMLKIEKVEASKRIRTQVFLLIDYRMNCSQFIDTSTEPR